MGTSWHFFSLDMALLDTIFLIEVHSKGDQSWVFTGRTDAKAETPILWPPHAKSWLIGKDSDAGKDWGQEEKVTTEDEMAGWHYWLNGHESEWTPGVGDGQGGLGCWDSWGRKESDTTERLNWTELKVYEALIYTCIFCKVTTTIRLVNISISPIIIIFLRVMITLKIYSLNNLQE